MSHNLQRELPMNSNCSGVLENRSISDVVLSLRTSCLDSDYKAAVRELMDREEGLLKKKEEIVDSLREKNGILEADFANWKIRYCTLEGEVSKLKRDFYENEKMLKDLGRELSLKSEEEERVLRRYERLLQENEALEDEKRGYDRKVLELSSMVDDLEKKLKSKEAEMDEIVGKNAELKARLVDWEGSRENVELDACLVKLHQEKEVCKRIDDDIKQLEDQFKTRCVNESMQQTELYLNEQFTRYDALVEELRKNNEVADEKMRKLLDLKDRLLSQLEDMKKANDEHIKKLEIENEGLDVKNKELAAELVLAKEKLSKLEQDMFTFMCFDLGRDPRFASAPVGKVFSGIIKALDPEKSNLNSNAGGARDGVPQQEVFASQSDLLKRSSEPEKQSREAVERLRRRSVSINIDRGDEYGNPLHVNSVRNKRQWPGSLYEQRNHGSGNDTPNPIPKVMKRNHMLPENVQQEPPHAVLSASRIDHASNTSQKQTLAILEQNKENYRGKDKVSSGFSTGNCIKNGYGTSKATELFSPSPRPEELMACILQRNQFERNENAAETACAFKQGDQYGNPLHVNGVRNKRQLPGSLNEQRNYVGSSDDTLNPIHKMMRHRHVLCENVQQEPSHAVLSDSRIDHVFNPSLKQKLATLIQSQENYWGKDKVSSSGFSNVNGCRNASGTSKANVLFSPIPQAEKLMASNPQRKQSKRIENAAEMARAFELDDGICAIAVCALHGLQACVFSGVDGFTYIKSKGLEECDIGRVIALGNILNSKPKNPGDELRQECRAECKRLALKYSELFFDVINKIGYTAIISVQ